MDEKQLVFVLYSGYILLRYNIDKFIDLHNIIFTIELIMLQWHYCASMALLWCTVINYVFMQ